MDITTVMLIEYWLDSAGVWRAKITVDDEKLGGRYSDERLDNLYMSRSTKLWFVLVKSKFHLLMHNSWFFVAPANISPCDKMNACSKINRKVDLRPLKIMP